MCTCAKGHPFPISFFLKKLMCEDLCFLVILHLYFFVLFLVHLWCDSLKIGLAGLIIKNYF